MTIENENFKSSEKPSIFETRYGSVRNEETHTVERRQNVRNHCMLMRNVNKSPSSKFF